MHKWGLAWLWNVPVLKVDILLSCKNKFNSWLLFIIQTRKYNILGLKLRINIYLPEGTDELIATSYERCPMGPFECGYH